MNCNYAKLGDCDTCHNRQKCILIKPYFESLREIELKRIELEHENDLLCKYISEWDNIEKHLSKFNKKSVQEVNYYERKQEQMIGRVNDNKRLINAYLKKESKLVSNLR